MSKIRQLRVRPLQSCDLAFPMAGILMKQFASATLGRELASAFDLTGFYAKLAADTGDATGKLLYDAAAIRTELEPNSLFSLRNEHLAAALDQAIAQRQAAFLERFLHAPQIATLVSAAYGPDNDAASRIHHLKSLRSVRDDLHAKVKSAYETAVGKTDFVFNRSKTVTTTKGDIRTEVYSRPIGSKNESEYIVTVNRKDGANWKEMEQYKHGSVASMPAAFDPGGLVVSVQKTDQATVLNQVVTTKYDPLGFTQTAIGDSPDLSAPRHLNDADHHRSQADLLEEILQDEVFRLGVPKLPDVLKAESRALDLEIRKLQVAYANTFLISPISGWVTGIYKDMGENVGAGDAVARVENDKELLLTGVLNHRGRIRLGTKVVLGTQRLFESAMALNLTTTVVSIRGHDSDDDEWEVILRATNPPDPLDASRSLLPINYQFDRDTTTVTIS